MHSFRDKTGRAWNLEITIGSLKRIRSLVGVNLYDDETIQKLYDDPAFFMDVLFAVVQPQADALKVTDEEFGRAFDGEIYREAHAALIDELPSFSQSPNLLQAKKLIQKKQEELQGILGTKLQLINPEMIADAILKNASKLLPGLGLESSESTPTSSPSENST